MSIKISAVYTEVQEETEVAEKSIFMTIVDSESIDMVLKDAQECGYKFDSVRFYVDPSEAQLKELSELMADGECRAEWELNKAPNIELPLPSGEYLRRRMITLGRP